MALTDILFENINQGHLQRLIDSKSVETLFIEYKRETYGASDANRIEFLADISSFANAAGGDLLIGIAATDGIPSRFVPFIGVADAEILRLEQMARAGLQPRIPNLQIKAIPLDSGGATLIIRIPRSYRQPHRITYQQRNRFWSRSSAGKYEPNVDELRILFTYAPQLADKMQQFRGQRITRIAADEGPLRLLDARCLILHVIPFSHFSSPSSALSIADLVRDTRLFPPLVRPNDKIGASTSTAS